MRRTIRAMVIAGVVGASLFVVGFIVFANRSMRLPPEDIVGADGIVVLTGGSRRIDAGLGLLHRGLGRRLLISGVNPRTTRQALYRHVNPAIPAPKCCVDIGYRARDTIGNARETRDWARRHGFKSLIVVTSSYHVPRSLSEIGRALPDVQLKAYPVVPSTLHGRGWWQSFATTRLLVAEYIKLLPSAARYMAARVLNPIRAVARPGSASNPHAAAF